IIIGTKSMTPRVKGYFLTAKLELLTLLMKLELRLKSTLFTILRQIRALQYEPFAYFKESFAPG
ncbi:hypothetical protein, partial [Alkalibacterium indicireducens]|uniref:hypothetical protein n=1 Tax=Alkalibacterium indicireducens TaxID=398758 RepID=UPI0031F87D39